MFRYFIENVQQYHTRSSFSCAYINCSFARRFSLYELRSIIREILLHWFIKKTFVNKLTIISRHYFVHFHNLKFFLINFFIFNWKNMMINIEHYFKHQLRKTRIEFFLWNSNRNHTRETIISFNNVTWLQSDDYCKNSIWIILVKQSIKDFRIIFWL